MGVLEGELLTKNKLEMKLQSLQEVSYQHPDMYQQVVTYLLERSLWGQLISY